MSENKPPLAPGAPLGPYTLQALLGRGQDTEVYRSYSPEVKRDVALKIYHPKPGQISGTQFTNDVGAIAALKHPNIMRIFDYGVEGDLYYIVMELVEGSSLRDMLSTHPTGLARGETMRLFSQLDSAVASAHDQGIVHGNLKPDNVLLDQSQRPVLTDFNIPCLRERGDAFRSSTPSYLAPEQIAGGTPLPQSDIYTLGILLYEMITGDVPFKGNTYEETISLHRSADPRPPGQIAVGLDPRVESAILKALSKKPSERYTSARDMLSAMESPEAADQFTTVSLTREEVQKRRSEIKQFKESRLDTPPIEHEQAAVLPLGKLPLVIAGAVLLAVIIIAVVVLVL